MNRGFYLTLMMGGFNASPVSQAVIDALTEVTVSSTVGAQGGFQMKFTLGKNSVVQQMLNSGKFDPRQRVIIAVTVNGSTEVLMDGIITKQDMTPSSAAGKSTLSITGLDLTALMDFIDFTGHPLPGSAGIRHRRGDSGQVRRPGRGSARAPREHSYLRKPARPVHQATGNRLSLCLDSGTKYGCGVLSGPGSQARHEPGLFGSGHQQDVRRPAAGVEHQSGCQHEHRLAQLFLRWHAGHAIPRHHHRAEHQDSHSHSGAQYRLAEGTPGGERAYASAKPAVEADRQSRIRRAPRWLPWRRSSRRPT